MQRGVLIAGTVGALAAPAVLGDYALFVLTSVAVLGIYAASYDLLFGFAGMLSLGHAVFFGLGGLVVAQVLTASLPGILASLILGAVAATVLAVPLGAIAVRVSSHAFVLVTLLFVLIAELVARSWPTLVGGTDGMRVTAPTVAVPGVGDVPMYDPGVRYVAVVAALVATVLGLRWLVATRFGLALRLIRDNPDRAAALGYDVRRLRHAAFTASAGVAGFAGGLQALVTEHVSAGDFSIMTTADPVVFTLLGGRGTVAGGVLGAGLVTGLDELLSGVTNAYPLLVGAAIIAVVVGFPDGVLGGIAAARRRWRERP